MNKIIVQARENPILNYRWMADIWVGDRLTVTGYGETKSEAVKQAVAFFREKNRPE